MGRSQFDYLAHTKTFVDKFSAHNSNSIAKAKGPPARHWHLLRHWSYNVTSPTWHLLRRCSYNVTSSAWPLLRRWSYNVAAATCL
jgi:hypothetical protein